MANFFTATTDNIVGGGLTQSRQDYRETQGFGVAAYVLASGSFVYAIKDLSTGSFVKNPTTTTLAAAVTSLRVVVSGEYYWVVVRAGTSVYVVNGSVKTPSTVRTATHQTDAGNYPLDACAFGANCAIVYRTTTTPKIFLVTANNVLGSSAIGLPGITTLTADWNACVAVIPALNTSSQRSVIVLGASTTTVAVQQFDTNFIDVETPRTFTAATAPVRISGVFDGVSKLFCVFDYAGSTKQSSTVTVLEHTTGSASATQTIILQGSVLATPNYANNKLYVVSLYDNDANTQATVFVHQMDANLSNKAVVARSLPNVAQARQTHVHSCDGLIMGVGKKVINTSSGVVNNTVRVIVCEDIVASLDCLDTLLFSGAYAQAYDGAYVTELGFLLYPETPTATPAASGGSMADGTYLYAVVFEHVDSNGRISRSTPSTPLSVTLSGGGTSQKVTLAIQTLWNTLKSDVSIAVYRTVDGGTTYYKVSNDAAPTANSTTATTVSFVDTLADSSITSRELLYTTGGVVEHVAPPSCSVIARYKDRVVVSGAECGSRLLYSKPITVASAFEFSDVLVESLNTENTVTAMQEMDNNLVVFQRNKILALSGEFADALGANSSLSKPSLLPSDVGSLSSVLVQSPLGIMFESTKGIWLLDRGLSHSYIGADVEGHAAVTSAVLLADQNKIIFTTAENSLVYDYYYKFWSTYSAKATQSLIWDSAHVILDSTVFKQGTSYGDGGSPYSTVIETGWISLAGLQGFQRLYNILLLGSYVGPHTLVVDVFYDFKQAPDDLYTADGDVEGPAYGDSVTYGSETFGGDLSGVYKFCLKPRIQKCSAVKLRIRDTHPESNTDGAFTLTSLALEVGVVGTTWKYTRNL
jgi:hypothetical protein